MSKAVDKSDVVAPRAAQSWRPAAGRYGVEQALAVVHDQARNRDIPIRIYAPSGATGLLPVVIFSHGIGESRDSYSYLGQQWASHGYIAVHLTHAGTDKAELDKGYLNLYRATKKPENWSNRPIDAARVIDRLLDVSDPLPLVGGRVDPARIAAAGHSAGAFTALALVGMPVYGTSLEDPRVKAAIALSMPKMDLIVGRDGYRGIRVPVLHMTGTCDSSLSYRTKARDRRVPFEQSTGPDAYLVTLEGGTHATFSDVVRDASSAEGQQQRWVADITTAFLDGWLRGEAGAREWVAGGGLSEAGKGKLVVEKK
jgi:predicted dienelactone hydrolase